MLHDPSTPAAGNGAAVIPLPEHTTKQLTRRAVLARTPAVIAVAGATSLPITAFASGGNDRHLAELWRAFEHTTAEWAVAMESADDVYGRIPVPAPIAEQLEDGDGGFIIMAMREEDIIRRFDGEERRERLALHRRYFAEVKAAQDSEEYERLEAAADAIWERRDQLSDEIIDTPADTVVGIQVKLQLLDEWTGLRGGDPHSHVEDPALLISIAKDVERLAKEGGAS